MTAPASSVPAIRQWIADTATTAVASFTDPTVEVYLSQQDHPSTEDIVCIGGVHRTVQPKRFVGGGGPFWADELYTVNVEISCYIAGPDAFPAVDVRAYQVLAAIETALRADPSAGGLVVQLNPQTTSSTHEWDEAEAGGICEIALVIDVHATQ